MQLKSKSWTDANGVTKTTYMAQPFDKDGNGLPDGYVMELKLVFDPKIDRFGNVLVVADWLNIPNECTRYLNEYNNLQLQFGKGQAKNIPMAGAKGKYFNAQVEWFSKPDPLDLTKKVTIKYVSLKPAVFGAKAPSSFSSEARSVRAENVAFQLEGVTLSQSSDALKITDEDSFIEYQLSEPSLFLREFAVQGYILPERFIGYLAQFEWSRKLDPGQQLALYYNILGQVKRMQVDVNPQQ